ncbi:serine/threonine-protein kinase [Polyangium jinanense]|uniref:Protein kinase n=1 Tax=Polyangium jinanense TaxID=2829994 RepID=A0A9X3X5K7_9BACT|nr:serine/threonine-protein kinase [Polyangium jinanense]MDC3979925.1 protein kinase [Polyangium jinanense]MDC3982578.1 protein kinase [Polyangium jinanense]
MPAADAPLPDAPTSDGSLVGRDVGKYKVSRLIARGGMGAVYEALNTSIGKRVAMKFVDPELARNADAVARFQREAAAASAVESAHIVTIFDSGVTDDGQPFIVMELLRGEDLGHRIKRLGRLDLDVTLDVIAQLLRGLCRAHEAGIVHRDLKPDNVFLAERDDQTDFVKILDFGISKVRRTGGVPEKTITRQGTVLGTPFYMSPEQSQALPDIDERTDLWSVGAILYECLTGRPPHEGQSYEQVIVNICTKAVPDVRTWNPEVPEAVARFLVKALKRNRDKRFPNAREMLDALGAASGGLLPARALRVGDTGSRSSPDLARNTPRAAQTNESATRPAEEVGTGGPSRVGWSTNSGASGGKERSRALWLGLGAFAAALAIGVGVMYSRSTPTSATPASPVPPTTPASEARVEPAPEPVQTNETNPAEAPAPEAAETKLPAPEPSEAPRTTSTSTRKTTKTANAKPEITPPQASAKPTATMKIQGVAPQLKLKVE